MWPGAVGLLKPGTPVVEIGIHGDPVFDLDLGGISPALPGDLVGAHGARLGAAKCQIPPAAIPILACIGIIALIQRANYSLNIGIWMNSKPMPLGLPCLDA